MLRLRELAFVTACAMAGMTALVAGAKNGLQIPGGTHFHFASTTAAKPVLLASNAANGELRLGLKGSEALAQTQLQPLDQFEGGRTRDVAYVNQAMDRLRTKVPGDLYSYFDVFLYVSKAAQGPLAQHMYIFHKDARGDVVFEQMFPVSTGRERYEKYFTTTPIGLFELDPDRFKRYHYSRTWHAGMPYSMFLNATIRGRQTGIALHSAGGHAADLGHRASGGCVRLPPEKAAELFKRFQDEERGYVPMFAFDAAANRTSQYGQMVRDSSGKPVMYYGYKVLLIIENYDGGPVVVAAVV